MNHQSQPTIDLWERGMGDHHTYLIPALVTTISGAILAFCEGRRDGGGDSGQIDMLLRRSLDGGRSWEPAKTVTPEPGFTNGNPAPVPDRRTGTVVLMSCWTPPDMEETDICAGRAARTVWGMRSTDEGLTWSEPEEITASAKAADWTWYATGPGHGVQLESGRLDPLRSCSRGGHGPLAGPLPVTRDPQRRRRPDLGDRRGASRGDQRIDHRSAARRAIALQRPEPRRDGLPRLRLLG